MRGHDSLDHLRRVFAVLAVAMLWSAVPARADQILQTSGDSLTTYKHADNTRVQDVRPRAEQRGVGFDGAQRAGGSLPWALAGNPFESAQAHVLIGQPGIRRNDPDFLALTVGNYVLGGGGFVSRLYTQVREKRGLSYSVYSYFAPGLHAGAFSVGLQTRPDQAAQAIALSHAVVAQFVREGPSEQELLAAKSNLIGGFALRLDSNRKLLDNVANIAWNKLPLDYLDTWTASVERLTVADVRTAFARVLRPETMVTVVVGARDKVP